MSTVYFAYEERVGYRNSSVVGVRQNRLYLELLVIAYSIAEHNVHQGMLRVVMT
jgi:hypothetical protein